MLLDRLIREVGRRSGGVIGGGAVAVSGYALHVLEEDVVVEAELGSLGDEASHDGPVDDVVDPPEGADVHDPRKKLGDVPGLDDERDVVGGGAEIGVREVVAVGAAVGR